MPHTTSSVFTVDVARLIETDLEQHIEDDIEVNAIRDGKLVQILWNELTEDERRAVYIAMFNPCRSQEGES